MTFLPFSPLRHSPSRGEGWEGVRIPNFLNPFLQFFLFSKKTGGLYNQDKENRHQTHNHNPVGSDIGRRKGLSIPDEKAGNNNSSGTPQSTDDTHRKGIQQDTVSALNSNRSQREDSNRCY